MLHPSIFSHWITPFLSCEDPSMHQKVYVADVIIHNSQSIPGSCLMAGTMVLGEVSRWYMVLVGSVNTWGGGDYHILQGFPHYRLRMRLLILDLNTKGN